MPLFGTDGVRGLANGLLTAELALHLAQATAVVLGQGRSAEARKAEGRRLTAVVARDPRVSGEFLAAAVAAGLASSGVDVLDAGVIPTPATAFLIADHDADFGVMVSASHNPAPDNGIKIFARGGTKLPDIVEQRIERALEGERLQPTGAGVGRIRRFADAEDRYVLHLLGSLPHRLDGIHVVLDCAHGAAAGVSPETFKDAGAQVTVIGADPTVSTSTTAWAPPTSTCSRKRSSASGPTWASRTTATPTAASRWTRRATSSTATRSWRSSRSR